ncbi:MAG TPA: VOC family protein [Acidimicrobiales bacterium]|jgi:4a-hydroxytetrahydrobiopterin dehydratase
MPEWISPSQFHASDGIDDWRVLGAGVGAHFTAGSLTAGADLVRAVAEAAREAGCDPAVDLRADGVTVRLPGTEHGLDARYVDLARRISAAAGEAGATADPAAVQDVQTAIDAMDIPSVRRFWAAVLAYEEWGDEDVVDPHRQGPPIWFQQMDAPRPQRNRIHFDVFVPHDQAQARIAAALAAGGRMVSDAHAPASWLLADPEGNEVCVATWQGRD